MTIAVTFILTVALGKGNTESTFVSSTISLVSGDAKIYHEEYFDRVEVCLSNETQIIFDPFTKRPDPLYYSDIKMDPKFWDNMGVSRFYNKHSTRLSLDYEDQDIKLLNLFKRYFPNYKAS